MCQPIYLDTWLWFCNICSNNSFEKTKMTKKAKGGEQHKQQQEEQMLKWSTFITLTWLCSHLPYISTISKVWAISCHFTTEWLHKFWLSPNYKTLGEGQGHSNCYKNVDFFLCLTSYQQWEKLVYKPPNAIERWTCIYQHRQDLCHIFVDFTKALDRVWHAVLWATMWMYINASLMRTIEYLYNKATSSVFLNGTIGDRLKTTVGLWQSCLHSSTHTWTEPWLMHWQNIKH